MQVLYAYALEPIEEATGDRKSFAFRKGRSPEQLHFTLMHCLTDIDAPEWVLVSDIEAYYDTISHKWLLDNIPIDKKILREFLKAGFMFNGEFFNKDEGISLGSNLSTILGNMTLDGLQKRLFSMQGEKISDFKNGYCIRFADDVCIFARTEKDIIKFKEILTSFVNERGLKLSEKKTKIVHIKEGFEFLSRFYCKVNGIIRCIPTDKAVEKFEMEVEEMILNQSGKSSQSKVIDNINAKINGFVTYHKCEESLEVFKRLDVIINALLLKMMKNLYPNMTNSQLINKYWVKDYLGRQVYTVPNTSKSIKNLADTILISGKKADYKRNAFLDVNYFKEMEQTRDIRNCVGKYRTVWDRQNGLCYICSKPINLGQEKEIIFKKHCKDKSINNLAYVHSFCRESIIEYVTVDDKEIGALNVNEMLLELEQEEKITKITNKFEKLSVYFHNLKKKSVRLTFKKIEQILGCKLCKTAYKSSSYFWAKGDGRLSKAWLEQGYKIEKLDMKNYVITFVKIDYKRNKIKIPEFIYRNDLPKELVDEVNGFFLKIKEKYRMK